MGIRTAFTVMSLFSIVLIAQNEEVVVHNGFGDGGDYAKWSSSQRQAYAMGFVNGIMVAPIFGAPKARVEWAEQCLEDMTDEQVSEIVAKYVREHPEEWPHGLHINSYNALEDACPQSPKNRAR